VLVVVSMKQIDFPRNQFLRQISVFGMFIREGSKVGLASGRG
jgi:hypothetical protein